MISWGVLGLLDAAVETYDPELRRRAKFESFAISKIRWAILDELRGQDWVPRRVRNARPGGRTRHPDALARPAVPSDGGRAEGVGMGVEEFCGFWIGTRAPRSPH